MSSSRDSSVQEADKATGAAVTVKLPHIHWFRRDGWDFGRGRMYFCRCGKLEHRSS